MLQHIRLTTRLTQFALGTNSSGTTLLRFNKASLYTNAAGYSWTALTFFGRQFTNRQAAWGALYSTSDGYLYATDNTSGQIWKFPLPGLGLPLTNATLVATGPTLGSSVDADGARCWDAGPVV